MHISSNNPTTKSVVHSISVDAPVQNTENKRWSRVENLSFEDELALRAVIEQTPGMSLYGNRARVSVMLPVDIAQYIADVAKQTNKSVSQTIVDILQGTTIQ